MLLKSLLFLPQVTTFSMMVVLFFTAGILWPVEGMPVVIQKVFQLNPIMLPIRSLRSIMLRGWSPVNHFSVAVGYITAFVNCLVLFVVESILFHYSVKSVVRT